MLSLLLSLLLAAGGAAGQSISVPQLQRLLQQTPRQEQAFRETRESRWLAAPLVSSGTLKSSKTMLEKSVEQPRQEHWQIFDDHLLRVAPDGAATRIAFDQAPALAALARLLRQIVAGDLMGLERDFELAPRGDLARWSLRLTPRPGELARHLKQVELQGSEARLRTILIEESAGDRSTIQLLDGP